MRVGASSVGAMEAAGFNRQAIDAIKDFTGQLINQALVAAGNEAAGNLALQRQESEQITAKLVQGQADIQTALQTVSVEKDAVKAVMEKSRKKLPP